ncbi:MAG: trigger factor [Endomicrobium sp.]|uniref:trigger factor n=1 Tax=Candidatus Endomicrobiellum pyrsonymphae TaxID=1408203 RepID=UPI003574F96C|nr:trigger factor [Endomicrobium sp.]
MAQEKKTIDFKSSVIDKKSCSITVDVEVSENIVAEEINSAFSQIQRKARIDGFRQGKVPVSIVKQKFTAEAKDRAVESIIRKTVLNVLEKEVFAPIDFPVVEEFNYELGQALKYRFTAERHPQIDAKDYKNIPVIKEVFKITDESLSQSLDALRERNAKLVPSKSGDITNESFVSVDYDAFDTDGKALPEITARGHMLDLSSENVLKGFRDALAGTKIGKEKDADIEYPADYPNKTLAGKTISFKIKVIEVKEKELPELSDDFAKDMGIENLEGLKTKVKETIEVEEKRRQDMNVEKQIIAHLLEKNKFEVPQSLVEEQKKTLVKRMKDYMQNQGASKEYVEKEAELKDAKFKEEAEKDVRLSYILNAIYLSENLTVADADIEAEKNKMRTSNPGKESAVNKYFIEKKENIMLSLKEQKLFGFLIDNAKIKVEEKDMPLKKD